jgi:hypothetical protein
MPTGKLARLGVWEDGEFVGVVLFGLGGSKHLLTKYGLRVFEGCELVRIAMAKHKTPVSKVVAIAIRMLRTNYPKLKVIVSFADPAEGHVGSIYQAGNWIYTGTSACAPVVLQGGKVKHVRSFGSHFGRAPTSSKAGLPTIKKPGKHRYVYPLDRQLAERIEGMRLPYPRKRDRSSG